MTKLSYGFLSFNYWYILERTLESAKKLQHTQGDVQWVIVDNSQPDYYLDMQKNIAQWADDNPSLHIDFHFNGGVNSGEGGGMNQCFELCLGENILFFQDDWECIVNYPFIDLAIDTLDKFQQVFMVQLGKRPWSSTNANVKIGRVLMTHEDKTVFEMHPNQWGNNTFQIRLFKKDRWSKIGHYLEDKDIGPQWKGHRPGSVSERDYGVRLQSHGFLAAKINDGQFKHTIEENARVHFINNE